MKIAYRLKNTRTQYYLHINKYEDKKITQLIIVKSTPTWNTIFYKKDFPIYTLKSEIVKDAKREINVKNLIEFKY